MNIVSSKFEISNSDVSKCPSGCRHEYAFIGRSNVGKSSLINNEWYIVDLPGYGYAQRGKEMQRKIRKIIEDYILERGQMTNLFLLVDSRHEPQKIDLEFMEWLAENEIPFAIVFTKIDKLSANARKIATGKYLDVLREQWEELPPVFYTSSSDGRGREELLDYIEELNKLPLLCE